MTSSSTCNGILSGFGDSYLCDNGNWIFLQTPSIPAVGELFLEGVLAVEGDMTIGKPLTVTTTSLVLVADTVYLQGQNLTVSVPTDFVANTSSEFPIVSAGNIVGQFASVAVNSTYDCIQPDVRYTSNEATLFFIPTCYNFYKSWTFIFAISVGIAALLIAAGGLYVYISYDRRFEKENQIFTTVNKEFA